MSTIAIYRGTIQNDAFYFAPIINGLRIRGMILDTGAFELTFNKQVADKLGLPNLGTIQVEGVGGTAQAYQSICTILIRGTPYPNTPCIVDGNLTDTGLFGLRFFIDNQLKLQLNPIRQTLVVSTAQ